MLLVKTRIRPEAKEGRRIHLDALLFFGYPGAYHQRKGFAKMTMASSLLFAKRLLPHIFYRFYVYRFSLISTLACAGCHTFFSQEANQKTAATGHTEDVTINVQTDKSRIQQEENTLIAQQQNLAEERTRLQKERQSLTESLGRNPKTDTQSIDNFQQQQKQLWQQEQKLSAQQQAFEHARSRLDADKTALLERLESLSQHAPSPTTTSPNELTQILRQHEAAMLAREKALDQTQRSVTELLQQVQNIADTLQSQMQAWDKAQKSEQNTQAHPGAPIRVTRAQLQQQVTQIGQQMHSKGILAEDLPQNLQQYTQSPKKSATPQELQSIQETLERTQRFVSATLINRAFVESKMARINRSFQQSTGKLEVTDQKKVEQWLNEATDAFSDGRYDRANRKINEICGLLERTKSK